MKELSIILGAGFSANAGLPLAKAINERFNRNQIGKLRVISSTEWYWEDGKDQTVLGRGKFNVSFYYSYLLNELVHNYNIQNNGFTDYEDFFQYIIDNSENQEWEEKIEKIAFNSFQEEHPHSASLRGFRDSSNIIDIINYLIRDLLSVQVSPNKMIEFYKPFVDYITSFDNVSIFTLNHDFLLEDIFKFFAINYSNGFSEKESPIYFEDKPLPIFTNDFSGSKIKLLKLHGSIDCFRFLNAEKSQHKAKYNYFTTRNHREKHRASRIDLKTGEIIQKINQDIVPKFITGKNKSEIIKNDMMYSALYNHFQKAVSKAENLLISGYSFGDEHINLELEKRTDINIINHRKSSDYPFLGNIKNISSFDEL